MNTLQDKIEAQAGRELRAEMRYTFDNFYRRVFALGRAAGVSDAEIENWLFTDKQGHVNTTALEVWRSTMRAEGI